MTVTNSLLTTVASHDTIPVPSDLSPDIVAIARRLQALAPGVHLLAVIRSADGWAWAELGAGPVEGRKRSKA